MFWYKDLNNDANKPLVARGCFANYTCTEDDLKDQDDEDKQGPCNEANKVKVSIFFVIYVHVSHIYFVHYIVIQYIA